jgi:LPXTG-motif cell wall-anchored protein
MEMSTLMQAGVWLAAGGCLLFFLKRRRARRTN